MKNSFHELDCGIDSIFVFACRVPFRTRRKYEYISFWVNTKGHKWVYVYMSIFYFLFSHVYHRIEDGWKHIGHMNTLHSNDTRLIKKTVFQWCVCSTNLVQENSQKRWQFQRQPMYDVQCNECTAPNVFNILCVRVINCRRQQQNSNRF